jgi:hypothetical protein
MPRFVILLGADALLHASVFFVATYALSGYYRNALITLPGKLNMTTKVKPVFAATLCDLVLQWLEYAGFAVCRQRLNRLRSCAAEPQLAHWIAGLKQLEQPVRHRRCHHP